MLRVEDLRVYYKTLSGYVRAVDGVTFTLSKGEILGIAGESGSGKSTLVNYIILPKPPMVRIAGSIVYRGIDLTSITPGELSKIRYTDISIVPQYAMDALSPTKRIRTIIRDLTRGRAEGDIEERARERLRMVGLPGDVLDRYPIELSGGMRQRVVLVISTLLDPDVLIADEVTSALDVTMQRAVLEMLASFRDTGIVRSIILVSHDIAALYQVADRIMIMYAGKISEIGPAEEVIGNPLHPYTRALIDSVPRLGVRYKTRRLTGLKGEPPRLASPPTGCRFHPRCSVAEERCRVREPPPARVGKRTVYCWLYTGG